MFTVYFDGSGSRFDPNTPVLAVAGFVATAEQWIHFERIGKKSAIVSVCPVFT
jgi:hypothetical protein